MSEAVRITIKDISLFERDTKLRMPFRFGIVTLREAPQLFAKVTVEDAQGRQAQGMSAEVLAPKWFDKNPDLTNEDNFEQLRQSVYRARALYTGKPAMTPFALFADHYTAQMDVDPDQRLNASFGQAVLDRAVLDAVCRLENVSFYTAIRENIVGMSAHDIIPELQTDEIAAFLAGLSPATSVAARHTVGLVDPLSENPDPVGDGLPETLVQVVNTYGHQYYKIKVGGNTEQDIARLIEVAEILEKHRPDYLVSLDGNEQYPDADAFLDLFERMQGTEELSTFVDRILFIEQPIARSTALSKNISAISASRPVIIDESDSALDVFPSAIELGYAGVSSKSCKGFYKSLINLLRCRKAGAGYFMSAEDLTMQAGIGVQQDLALVSLLGLTHVERNGHHYVNGLNDVARAEQLQFLEAHPDLYHDQDGAVRLRIENGALDISSLDCPGFASRVLPDVTTMRPVG